MWMFYSSRSNADGACNQGKRLLEQNNAVGATPPSVTTGENFQNARLRVSQETGKKKKPPQ